MRFIFFVSAKIEKNLVLKQNYMNNFNSGKERFVYYLEIQGSNRNKFYLQSGVSNGALDKKTGLTEATILKIFEIYPDISLDWLLLGIGEMNRQPQPDSGTAQVMIDKISELSAKLALLEKENQELKEKLKSASAKTNKAVTTSL